MASRAMHDGRSVVTTCGGCYADCAFAAHVVDGRVVAELPAPGHPCAARALCARGRHRLAMPFDERDRILHPMRRRHDGSGFDAVSWDEAFSEIAARLAENIDEHGARALGMTLGVPSFDRYWAYRFMHALGSPNVYGADGACEVSRLTGWEHSLGYSPASDLAHTDCIMYLGRSIVDSSTMGAVDALNDARRRGAKIIVVDPRRSGSAALADRWLRVRPGCDLALLLGIAHVLIAEGLYDHEFVTRYTTGFDELAQAQPEHFAVKQYVKFKMAAGKTLKSILVSCGARLAPFDIEELREVTAYDELELDTLGDRKTALFLIMSDTDASFNFLISMIYSQLFNLLCEKADDVYGGRLPVHVRCLIDEAANIGQIPQLEKLVATIRSREISACLILQAQSQLKALYKDNADTIIGNMDSRLFLGGSEPTTLKELSTALGKETIDTFNTGESRGRETSHSLNYQKLGKELASVDELAVLDGGKCILQLRGVRPFLSEKYDITKHPNYKYLSDADRRNTFDIEKFLSTKLKVKPEETYDSYEAAVTEELSSV